jgi:hypothetical protein
MTLIFVDCEADMKSPCPGLGLGMTEFGAVEYVTEKFYHGCATNTKSWYTIMLEFEQWLHEFTSPFVFISDNNGYDWQWINYYFWHQLNRNPFGHSSRRITDYYAGLCGNFRTPAKKWKRLRVTPHDHNPVHDAMGNLEAFKRMEKGER